jgi:hypothetical protein
MNKPKVSNRSLRFNLVFVGLLVLCLALVVLVFTSTVDAFSDFKKLQDTLLSTATVSVTIAPIYDLLKAILFWLIFRGAWAGLLRIVEIGMYE